MLKWIKIAFPTDLSVKEKYCHVLEQIYEKNEKRDFSSPGGACNFKDVKVDFIFGIHSPLCMAEIRVVKNSRSEEEFYDLFTNSSFIWKLM